jgi:hypothetical protein
MTFPFRSKGSKVDAEGTLISFRLMAAGQLTVTEGGAGKDRLQLVCGFLGSDHPSHFSRTRLGLGGCFRPHQVRSFEYSRARVRSRARGGAQSE